MQKKKTKDIRLSISKLGGQGQKEVEKGGSWGCQRGGQFNGIVTDFVLE
jgi:hypothetical protein